MKKTILTIIAALGMGISGTAEAGWDDGMVSIANARPDGVRVMIDRSYVGSVMPADAEAFALTPGRHHVLVTCSRGVTLAEQTLDVEPFEAEAITIQAQAAALAMTNSAGTTLFIEVDGERLATLAPNEQTALRIPGGAHRVTATYMQHGESRSLSSDSLRLTPGQTESIRFSPAATGLVKVVNPFGQTARVRIDGQDMGSIGAGRSRLIESSLGSVHIQLLINNRVVAAERLSVQRYHDTTFRAQPEPVAVDGRLELSNHRSGTVKIYIDGRLAGSIPSWSERTFTLPIGPHQVKAVSSSGSVLFNRMVEIDRYEELEVELGAQSSTPMGATECGTPVRY